MKQKIAVIFIILFTLISCKKEVSQKEISSLNGYWEIQRVELPKGEIKEYKINESVDFFQVDENLNGFRKKLIPQLDGKFLTNEVEEKISVSFKDDLAFIKYSTEFANWTEEIKELNSEELVLTNEQGITYVYKRKVVENE